VDTDLESIQEARDLVERAHRAWLEYRSFSQQRVNTIVDAMAAAATANAERLARMAVEETTYGKVEDKIQKNLFSSQRVYQAIRGMRTVGVIREDADAGITEIAEAVGVVAAILPSTNPTSTAIYKVLISLKAGNSIVVSPHPAAMRCICEAVSLMANAARDAGAPADLICCFSRPSLAGTQELMKQRRTAIVLATGGMGIVKAAYSSGKPAFGVGPGNVPAYVDRSADVAKAVADIVFGKTFDWGTICSSEQSLVTEESLRETVMAELRRQKAFFCDAAQTEALGRTLIHLETFTVNPRCVGQPPQKLAAMAGFRIPDDARVLVAELHGMGREVPLSAEKLSPVLSLYFVKDREAGFELCRNLLHFGGLGHTCVIHARDEAAIREYGLRMPAYRVVVNSPAPQGSIGATTNLFPAMTLGCGAVGGNITSDNIGPQHLINVKRVAYERRSLKEATVPVAMAASAGKGEVACACGHSEAEVAPARTGAAAASGSGSTAADSTGASGVASSAAGGGSRGLDRATIHRIVDRFIADRAVPAASAKPPSARGPAVAPGESSQATQPSGSGRKPEPSRQPVPFVCETDVRDAIRQNRKIAIGSRTVVTPSARDLGNEHKVFDEVATHESGQKSAGE
jgi:acetaldehyde dehydrogenase (acetylating)